MEAKSNSKLIIRIGIFFIFASFGVWEIIQSSYWVGFVPPVFHTVLPLPFLVQMHGAVLLFVGSGILLGKFLKFFAAAAAVLLLEIILSLFIESGVSDVLIRDIGIFVFTISLLF